MLRVVTCTVHSARQADHASLPALADLLRAQQADAIALIAPPPRPLLDELAHTLNMRAVYPPQDQPPLAWLTRLPILSSDSHEYLPGARPLLRLDVAWQGLRVGLFAVHFRSGWALAAERARSREVVALLQYLPRVGGEPHLVAGNFAALHPADTAASGRVFGVVRRRAAEAKVERLAIPLLLDAGYTDCFRALHRSASRDPGYTFPAPQPRLRSDYFFASAQLARRLVACDVVTAPRARLAAHCPVTAEFV